MRRDYTAEELREIRKRRNRIRRERQLRRRFILTFMIVAIIVFSVVGINTKAQSSSEVMKQKQYTSVMVPYGSSLYDIAEEYIDADYYNTYDEYISEVKFINHLSDDTIQAGNYIIVPYYEAI